MSYQLTNTQQEFAESQVLSGAYESTDKVIEAALAMLRERQAEYERLANAIAQDERGEHVPLDIEKIKRAGREALRARQSNGEC